MRLLVLVLLFLTVSNMMFTGSYGVGGSDTNLNKQGIDENRAKNESSTEITNQAQIHNQTQNQIHNQTQEQLQNQTLETNQTDGVLKQIHQLNGSITIPQGLRIKIEAHNHIMNFGNETQIMLNETFQLNLNLNGKNKSFTLKFTPNGISITDEGITVQTNETLEIDNETLKIGGKFISVMPSDLPELVRTREISSVILQVTSKNPLYILNATKKAKVFWIFDTDMKTEVTIDANTGQIICENKPWWAFLASVLEE
ncbi:MAG: hypothetical protein WC501_05150 [Candidatus Micrarchaeia archaeon]